MKRCPDEISINLSLQPSRSYWEKCDYWLTQGMLSPVRFGAGVNINILCPLHEEPLGWVQLFRKRGRGTGVSMAECLGLCFAGGLSTLVHVRKHSRSYLGFISLTRNMFSNTSIAPWKCRGACISLSNERRLLATEVASRGSVAIEICKLSSHQISVTFIYSAPPISITVTPQHNSESILAAQCFVSPGTRSGSTCSFRSFTLSRAGHCLAPAANACSPPPICTHDTS